MNYLVSLSRLILDNLLFESSVHNRIFGLIANISVVVPHFSMFQRYHLDHHRKQGSNIYDTDIPSVWEGNTFTNTFLKVVWLFFQPVWYLTRPLFTLPKTPGIFDVTNWVVSALSGYAIWYCFGPKFVWYLFLSGYFGIGLHPLTAHAISEHYVFTPGQETYSYYGPLNAITFNVGFHNEHRRLTIY